VLNDSFIHLVVYMLQQDVLCKQAIMYLHHVSEACLKTGKRSAQV